MSIVMLPIIIYLFAVFYFLGFGVSMRILSPATINDSFRRYTEDLSRHVIRMAIIWPGLLITLNSYQYSQYTPLEVDEKTATPRVRSDSYGKM
jgi:hypothetical protein